MPTFRHLIAGGMGVAIALGNLEATASTTTRALASAGSATSEQLQVQNQTAQTAPSPPAVGDRADRCPIVEYTAPQFPPQPPFAQPGTTPEYLNPDPNPLLRPNDPEDVAVIGTQPITLQQAIDLARRNNPDLIEADLTLERAQASLREARAADFPTLTLRGDLTRSDSAQSDFQNEQREQQGLPTVDSTSTSLSSTLELNYPIYTAGRRSAAIEAAEKQVRLSELEVERLGEQVRLDVSNAYYDVQAADEQVKISQKAVENARQSLRDAKALERAGVGTCFDVLRAQVQLGNEIQNLTQGLRDQRVTRRQLAQLLSLSEPFDVAAADPVEIAGFWNLSLEESIVLALKNRAELEQQLVQREFRQQQRRIARADQGPQVNLFAQYNVVEGFNDDLGTGDGYALGARLQWELFNGGATRARADQETANIAIEETRFANQSNQVRQQVEQSFYDLRANFENIQTASVEVERATESLRLARLRFQAGVGTQTDVINAETELTRAEGNRLRAIVGYNRALANMQRSVSNLPRPTATLSP